MPRLIITREDGVQRQAPLSRGTIRVGRDPQADLCLEDPSKGVSRFHAEIRYDGSGYTIVDLDSRNGTLVNGKRVPQAKLAPGTVISLGPYELRFEGGDAPPVDESGGGYTVFSPPQRQQGGPGRAPIGGPPPAANLNLPPSPGVRPQWLLIGAAALVVVVLVVVAVFKTRNPSPQGPDSTSTQTQPDRSSGTPQNSPSDGAPGSSSVEMHLTEARRLIDAGQSERALNDHIDAVLKVDATNERGQKLRREAEDKLMATPRPRPAPPAPSPPPPRPPAPARAPAVAPAPAPAGSRERAAAPEKPVDTKAIPRRPGENSVDYTARSQRIQQHYAAAHSAFEKGELLDAIGQFEALHREQASYMDSVKLLADAQQRRKEDANHALEVASRAEESGLLLDALPAYERARRYDPSPAIDEKIARLRERMKDEGAKAYNDARKLDAFGKTKEATDLYHRAISLLPPDDDRRKEAVKRLETLAK